jgi:hypothetical protein
MAETIPNSGNNASEPNDSSFEILVIFLDNREEFETLTIDRERLRTETVEQTDDMLVVLTKLFYEKVIKKSPAWQKEGKDFEEQIKAYIAGKERIITLPPVGDPKKNKIYLHAGDGVLQSHFKAEGRLIRKFVSETSKIIYNEFAKRLDFGVLFLDAKFLQELNDANGVVLSFIPEPDGGFSGKMELI